MQYAHRMLGRALGVIYGAPLLYFGLRGRIPAHIRGRVAGLFALGGGQGLVGWWMVKSGLEVCIVHLRVLRVYVEIVVLYSSFAHKQRCFVAACDGFAVSSLSTQ